MTFCSNYAQLLMTQIGTTSGGKELGKITQLMSAKRAIGGYFGFSQYLMPQIGPTAAKEPIK